jgi:hypothetical protein
MLTKRHALGQQGALPPLPMCILGMMLKKYYKRKHTTLPKKGTYTPWYAEKEYFFVLQII